MTYPPGTSYTPWGPQKDRTPEEKQAAYMAAFVRYHSTKTHAALVRLRDANHARFAE